MIGQTGARLKHLPVAQRPAMETIQFILHNLPAIGERTVEHLSIVGVAVGLAIVTGVPSASPPHRTGASRQCSALHREHHHDDPVDGAVRRADSDPRADQSRHRLRAGRDRRLPLFAAADHQQHVCGIPFDRPCAARGRPRHGNDPAATLAAGRGATGTARHHRRRAHGNRAQHRHRGHRRLYRRRRPWPPHSQWHHADRHAPDLAGAIAVSLLALFMDRLFALLQRRFTSPGLASA